MALRTLSALAKAIDAVKKEAGDFAEYKPLLDALSGVSKEIGADGAASADAPADGDDPFQAAEKKHREATAANNAARDEAEPADEAKAEQSGEGK